MMDSTLESRNGTVWEKGIGEFVTGGFLPVTFAAFVPSAWLRRILHNSLVLYLTRYLLYLYAKLRYFVAVGAPESSFPRIDQNL